MMFSIPPKYAVAHVVGFIKGKSAIHIARNFMGHRKNFSGQHFWARGYYVSTVGIDETTIREYISSQEQEGGASLTICPDYIKNKPKLQGILFVPVDNLILNS